MLIKWLVSDGKLFRDCVNYLKMALSMFAMALHGAVDRSSSLSGEVRQPELHMLAPDFHPFSGASFFCCSLSASGLQKPFSQFQFRFFHAILLQRREHLHAGVDAVFLQLRAHFQQSASGRATFELVSLGQQHV